MFNTGRKGHERERERDTARGGGEEERKNKGHFGREPSAQEVETDTGGDAGNHLRMRKERSRTKRSSGRRLVERERKKTEGMIW